MAKVLTLALVVIMLIVGFAIGLFSAPFLMPQKSTVTDTIWENIQKTHIIKIGTDATWPPYQFRDNSSNIVGFEVDLAKACADTLGLTIEWHDVSFDTIVLSVQNGQYDMGVSGFSITPERLPQVSFTIPHSTTEGQVIMLQSIMTAKNITTLSSLADFEAKGITVGVQSGNVLASALSGTT